jgi:ABC-type amino acid transport substrate-binding protein
MKNKLLLSLALALAACSLPAAAGTDIGVSVGISQPGFYGRIDVGTAAAPPLLVYPQPVIIARPVVVQQRPIYLHVPPGHAKNWRKHCAHYGACSQPVYFVQEDWYRKHYGAPQHPGKGRGKGHDKRG